MNCDVDIVYFIVGSIVIGIRFDPLPNVSLFEGDGSNYYVPRRRTAVHFLMRRAMASCKERKGHEERYP